MLSSVRQRLTQLARGLPSCPSSHPLLRLAASPPCSSRLALLAVRHRCTQLDRPDPPSSRPLPTIEDVRRFSPAELEDARLQLSRELRLTEASRVEAFDAEKEARRVAIARLLGMTLVRLGSPLDAEEVIEDALASRHDMSDEERLELQFLLGVCYQKSGREEQALDAFERVLERTGGEHWRARFHMALISIANGWHAQGEAMLRTVLEHNPQHAESLRIIGLLEVRRQTEQNKLVPPADFE